MHSFWTSAVRTAQMIMHELQLSLRALMPAAPAVVPISLNGTRHSQLIQPVRNRMDWRRTGRALPSGQRCGSRCSRRTCRRIRRIRRHRYQVLDPFGATFL